jgi:hypothetical protein
MTTEEILQSVESRDFAARVGVASSLASAIAAIALEPATRALRTALEDAQVRASVLKRVSTLSSLRADLRFENQFDAALLAYLVLLRTVDRRLAFLAASQIRRAENLWWAVRLADSIVRNPLGHNRNAAPSTTAEVTLGTQFTQLREGISVDVAADYLYVMSAPSWHRFYATELDLQLSTLSVSYSTFAIEGPSKLIKGEFKAWVVGTHTADLNLAFA